MRITTQPWALASDELYSVLETSPRGLSDSDAETRLKKFGKNVFHTKEKVRAVPIFLKQFISPLIFLLIGASILTGLLAEWLDTSVIIFAVLLNVILGFFHEFHAENTLDKLTSYIKD